MYTLVHTSSVFTYFLYFFLFYKKEDERVQNQRELTHSTNSTFLEMTIDLFKMELPGTTDALDYISVLYTFREMGIV